jgi:uncharacterized membrane protein YsdA (DUF1294 family)
VDPCLVVAALFAVVNLVAAGAVVADKCRAGRHRRRIRERTLFLLAALGPAGAIVAFHAMRHKTRKPQFLVPAYALALVGALGWGGLFWWFCAPGGAVP